MVPDRDDRFYSLNETIAYNVYRLRFNHGTTQTALSMHIGVPMLTISRLETLRIKKINGKILNSIEDYFQVSRGFLDRDPPVHNSPYPKFATKMEQNRCNNYCRICGTKLYEDSKFCHKCGTKVLP